MSTAAIDLLHREIVNPDTQWSLGTFALPSPTHTPLSSPLGAWLASFDQAGSEEGDDEAALHHNG